MAEMFTSPIVQVQNEAIFATTEAAMRSLGGKSERDRKEKKVVQSMVTRYAVTPTMWNNLRGSLDAAVQRVNAYRDYRRTISELSDLTTRDLADLGLHRSEIRRVAYDSVYGAQR